VGREKEIFISLALRRKLEITPLEEPTMGLFGIDGAYLKPL
jgi:hypothetical protein